MATLKKLDNSRLEILKKIRLDAGKLGSLKPLRLTDLEIGKKLKVRPELLSSSVILSPNKPRTGNKYLSMYSSIMVIADPSASWNIAMFSSAFPAVTSPAVKVEFDPITAGKKHLVEFNITLHESSKVYKFRVFQYPTGNSQDISISGSQVISVLVNASTTSTDFGAEIMQLNTKAEACGWTFHSVKITSIS
ncbi:MAG: hypothetical protein ABIR78_08740 [Ferruginibacter sp.]